MKKYKQRCIQPDPVYGNVTLAKFINKVMKKGKKTVARKVVYDALELVKQQTNKDPLEVFDKAVEAVVPNMEVRPQRVGGATYQVPRRVEKKRAIALAIRWLIAAARARKSKPMKEKLAQELLEAIQNKGEAVRKKENMHRMAAANRAFAHLAR